MLLWKSYCIHVGVRGFLARRSLSLCVGGPGVVPLRFFFFPFLAERGVAAGRLVEGVAARLLESGVGGLVGGCLRDFNHALCCFFCDLVILYGTPWGRRPRGARTGDGASAKGRLAGSFSPWALLYGQGQRRCPSWQ